MINFNNVFICYEIIDGLINTAVSRKNSQDRILELIVYVLSKLKPFD